jgi:hypothetical protein
VSYSYEVGDQHNLEMALSLEVEGLDPTEMALAEEVNSAKTETEMPLSMEVAVPEETEASMTLEVGPLEESEMALAFEEEGAALEPLAGEAHSRSEPRAREEDT